MKTSPIELKDGAPDNDMLIMQLLRAINTEGQSLHGPVVLELERLRNLRCRWYGAESHELMYALNRYLRTVTHVTDCRCRQWKD